jgi:hypothetical protein
MSAVAAKPMAAASKYAKQQYHKEWYARNHEKRLAQIAVYEHTETGKARRRAAYKKRMSDPVKLAAKRRYFRDWKYKHKFGVSADDHDRMLAAQNGVCAICKRPEHRKASGVVKALAIDHDHATGKIRGLLCDMCNHALGNFEDDVDRMHIAIAYLEKYKELETC